jgi:hypothetical protein
MEWWFPQNLAGWQTGVYGSKINRGWYEEGYYFVQVQKMTLSITVKDPTTPEIPDKNLRVFQCICGAFA